MFNDANVTRARVPRTNSRAQITRVLANILCQAPKDHFTLGWVLSALQQHSFGVVILFLGVLATAPVGSSLPVRPYPARRFRRRSPRLAQATL